MDIRVFRLASVASFAFVVAALAVPVMAQTPKKPNMFETQRACEAALKSGNFRYYEPKYFNLYNQNPVNGKDRVLVPLEADTCLRLHVVGGRKFVVQEEGTLMRALKFADGSLVVYARDDCGNEAEGVTYPAPKQLPKKVPAPPVVVPPVQVPTPKAVPPVQPRPQPKPESKPESKPEPLPQPMPLLQINVEPTIVVVVLPPVYEEPEVVDLGEFVLKPLPQSSGWGLTAGGTIGKFSSSQVNGAVKSLAGRDACVDGRTADFGLAFGGPGQSFWRFTFMGMRVQDGSFTTYECKNCTIQVSSVSQNMKVLGGSLERVFMAGRKERSVRPMASLHGGVGWVSGQAYRYSGPVGKPPTSVENVGADQLFGSKFFAFAGGGIGLMGDIGNRLTYTVTVAGVEYPGVYLGGAQLTYWFK